MHYFMALLSHKNVFLEFIDIDSLFIKCYTTIVNQSQGSGFSFTGIGSFVIR